MTLLEPLGSPTSFPPLPQRWDGDLVCWGPWEELPVTSAEFHVAPYACDECGTTARPYASRGLRQPSRGEVFESIVRYRRITARWGRTYRIPVYDHIAAWPVLQWNATRCGWCGHTTVYDIDSCEHWILDDTDYGTAGSTRPPHHPHPAALAAEAGRPGGDAHG